MGVIEANARYARVVASAVGARDLKEVKRAVDHAKLTRREFSSACTRLGLVSDNGNAVSETGKIMATAASAPSVPSTQPTPSKLGLKSNLEGHPPVTFFLDAEARGGTTALALATIENDVGMVRRLIQEVNEQCRSARLRQKTRRYNALTSCIEASGRRADHLCRTPPIIVVIILH